MGYEMDLLRQKMREREEGRKEGREAMRIEMSEKMEAMKKENAMLRRQLAEARNSANNSF